MAKLPDPTNSLGEDDLAALEQMATARAYAEGRSKLGDVYLHMFNQPDVAVKVGALGEQLRFHGVLPDEVRETVILRFAYRQGFRYEWSHHQRPAKLAGLDQNTIDKLATDQQQILATLPDPIRITVALTDAIIAKESIPEDIQQRFSSTYSTAGLVEVVALCGLYSLMGYMTTAFEIGIEKDLPQSPF